MSKSIGGSARKVVVITSDDLEINGGNYKLTGKTASPVSTIAERKLHGGKATAVYVVSGEQIANGEYVLDGGASFPVGEVAIGSNAHGKVAIPVYLRGGGTLGQTYLQKLLATQPANLIQAFPLNETSGLVAVDNSGNGNDGKIAASGVTYGVDGIGDGETAFEFDGANTFIDMVDTVGNNFPTDWNGNLFSAIAWQRVDGAARWTDSSTFRWTYHVRTTDDTYYATFGKNSTNNQIEWRRRTGGAIVSLQHTFVTPPTDWFCMGFAHDQSSPVLNFYLWDSANGFQILTPSTSANLTDWGGFLPNDGTSVLYAGSLTLQEWIGRGAHTYTWNTMLSDAEMQSVMTL